MIPQDYRETYRAARLSMPLPDTLASIAAQIALEDRKRVDTINAAYQFAKDLKADLIGLRYEITRRKAPKTQSVSDMIRELAADMCDDREPEIFDSIDSIDADFDSVYEDR